MHNDTNSFKEQGSRIAATELQQLLSHNTNVWRSNRRKAAVQTLCNAKVNWKKVVRVEGARAQCLIAGDTNEPKLGIERVYACTR